MPDFLKLEKTEADSPKRLHAVIQMELVNEVFNALEDHFNLFLSQEYHSHMLDPELSSAIRFKKAVVTCVDTKGGLVTKMSLHALVLDKSSHFRMLIPSIAKAAKQIRHFDINITISVTMLSVPVEEPMHVGMEMDAPVPTCLKIFEYLTELYKVMYAYHRGVIMAKHVQFQCRFIHTLDILCERVRNQISKLTASQDYLPGRAILFASIVSYYGTLPAETKNGTVNEWINHIKKETPIDSSDKILGKHSTKEFNSQFFSSFTIRANQLIVSNSNQDLIFIDPQEIAFKLISTSVTDHFRLLDISSSTFSKDLQGGFGANEILFICGKIWTLQILSEISTFLKIKSLEKKTWTFRVFICIPDRKLVNHIEVDVKIIDWSYGFDMLSCKLFDILMLSKRPKFHSESTQLSNSYLIIESTIEKKSLELDEWYQYLLKTVAVEISLDETQIHDIILFQRETAVLDDLKKRKQSFELENQLRYDPYSKFVAFTMNIWDLLNNLKLKRSINVSYQSFIQEFESSLQSFPLSEQGNIHYQEFEACIGIR